MAEQQQLYEACKNDDVNTVATIISSGVTVNNYYRDELETPLYTAVMYGSQNVAKFLLQSNADVNKGKLFNDSRRVGELCNATPLIKAATLGNEDMVKILINRRADVNLGMGEDERMPLYLAIICGHPRVVDILLKAGANVNQVKLNGKIWMTPLQAVTKNVLGKDQAIMDEVQGILQMHHCA